MEKSQDSRWKKGQSGNPNGRAAGSRNRATLAIEALNVRYERSKQVADINPSTDNVRAMLTETLGRLRNASEEYFGLLEKGLSSSPLPIADQAKQFCNFMQRNVTATFDLGDKLSQAKDMQEALRFSPSSSKTKCGR